MVLDGGQKICLRLGIHKFAGTKVQFFYGSGFFFYDQGPYNDLKNSIPDISERQRRIQVYVLGFQGKSIVDGFQ